MRALVCMLLFATLVAGVLPARVALAQISPGPLARPHASLEGMRKCLECHELGSGPSADKCLACHREIAARLSARKGYHHRVVTLQHTACFECHSDHAGREFELVHWPAGRDHFDHAATGWALAGAHARAKCGKCHRADRIHDNLKALQPGIDLDHTYLGLGTACLSCHADAHHGQLGDDCARCHDASKWKSAPRFDHDKARFHLTGAHRKVACARCHPLASAQGAAASKSGATWVRYTGIDAANCTPCHRDPHRGKLGAKCASCHNTSAWKSFKTANFDHSKTRFPLRGRHASVACDKCHRGGDMKATVAFARCTDCHRDPHAGQFAARADGGRCESCHDENRFVPARFTVADHAHTRFALQGAHRAVKCESCHVKATVAGAVGVRRFHFESSECAACHKDPHAGQFAARADGGRCQGCHDQKAFVPARFTLADHARTRFPLEGAHRAQPCVACHVKTVAAGGVRTRRYHFRRIECTTCHKDPHAGQFAAEKPAKTCTRCHGLDAWTMAAGFDHDRLTRYRLEGKHRSVPCKGCHPAVTKRGVTFVRYRPIDPSCRTCHTTDVQTTGGP